MLNILKMDLHRFRTNKVMYFLLLLFMAFQVFGIFMMKLYEQPVENGGALVSAMNESEFMQFMFAQPPSWLLLYIVVFCVYFYMSELQAGFYKNYITIPQARLYSVITKIIILGVFTVLMFVAMLIADMLGRSLFFNQASLGSISYFVKLLLGQFLLHWAFSIVVLCIAMVTKSLIASIMIGVVLSFNVLGMLIGALGSLLNLDRLSAYLLVNTIVRVRDFHQLEEVVHVAGVGLVSLLLFSFIAIKYKLKEDLG